MTQVSKYPIREDVYQRILNIFLKTLINIQREDEALEFISEFLTPTEKIMLAKRLAIALLLKKGYDYQAIKAILRVSQGTVTHVNTFLKFGAQGYHRILDKIIKDERIEEFLDKVEKTILRTMPTAGRGKGAEIWRSLKYEVQRKKPKPF